MVPTHLAHLARYCSVFIDTPPFKMGKEGGASDKRSLVVGFWSSLEERFGVMDVCVWGGRGGVLVQST